MSLTSGSRIGPYEILSTLGAGGMGEVYRARDARLGRDVAIKVLPAAFSSDPDRLRRFEHEARAAAALNHPNICTIYDVGRAGEISYIAMELLEGETLADRLRRGALSIAEWLDLAIALSDGVGAAHAGGTLHRDLKPANIVLAARGPKVLDFGLAKAAAARATDATMSRAGSLTDAGTTVGTVAYMSPEQVRGEPLDVRSDLFSLGLVLYEAATGQPAFSGSTSAVISAGILHEDPVSPISLRADLPARLQDILLKALEKDRDVRYQSAADLHADLKRGRRDSDASAVTAGALTTRSQRVQYIALVVAALVVVLAVVGARFLYAPAAPITNPSEYTQITNFTDSATAPSLSPDGRMVTFIRGGDYFLSRGQIYVKLLPNGESVRLTNEPAQKFAPVFSPDGARVAYTIRGSSGSWDTWTVPVLGGQPTRLLPNASGLTWLDDHRVMFSEVKTGLHMGIVTATDSRATSRDIYLPAHERAMAHFSYASPDRSWALVVEMNRTGGWAPCKVLPLAGGSAGRDVGPPGSCTSASWSPDGRWMYFGAQVGDNAHLWRQRFPDGTPEQMTFGPTDEEGIAMAPDGRSLITSVGVQQSAIWMHDAAGDHPISSEGFAFDPKLSSDGKRMYYLLRQSSTSAASELSVVDVGSGKTDRVLPGSPMIDYDISPDETELAFTAPEQGGGSQIWLASLDRRSPPRKLADAADSVLFGTNGELVFRALEETANFLYRINKDGSGRERISSSPVADLQSVSPDGEWVVASAAAGGGRSSVARIAVPLHGGVTRTICPDSCAAQWSANGRLLYVTFGGSLINPTGRTAIVPIPRDQSLPDLPATGINSAAGWLALPGTRIIEQGPVAPGPDPSTYGFVKADLQRNLFRIPIH